MRTYILFERPRPRPQFETKSADILTRSFGASSHSGRIMVETLSEAEALRASRDRGLDITPVMPTSLIKPFETEAGAGDAWGIGAIYADRSPYDGSGVKVAVLDTGIAADHPAFAHVNLVQKDFSGSGNGDVQGHGSHCAGTIFGRDADRRIAVAPGITEAWIGKVLDDQGRGSSEMVFSALNWAMEAGVNIISLSLGFDFPKMVEEHVEEGWPVPLATSVALEAYRGNLRMFDGIMSTARAREAFGGSPLIIAAAGNESRRDEDSNYRIAASLPAAGLDVISVAALGIRRGQLEVADYSNTQPVLAAPGSDILSVDARGRLRALSGTSMACPHVAGIAALWWQKLGARAKASSVAAQLRASCRLDVFGADPDPADIGEGLVTAPV